MLHMHVTLQVKDSWNNIVDVYYFSYFEIVANLLYDHLTYVDISLYMLYYLDLLIPDVLISFKSF